ncbi:PREDICTED: epsin-1-like isoform X1 [Amphimedon queenslandica]|uniref:ENTH domain-containing protein n=1 Tax=Amphimedon queenslandica TaxID=400682 RepID=A0AAN0J3X1_AMPQE|nr:PREDICTED: epsin-1-like isoform X1 [Amphimedon queenslandica]|eukprot:XP_019851408.1 PREDICTED: epsin-1-like isoform X1 [Amphimedon queenslandica]
MSKLRREFKNVVYNYTDAEVKVRDATSNEPWGPSGTVMAEIAEYTFHIQAYALVMGMLWKRLNDHGKNWRHVYKSLVVLEYLVKSGSERVVQQCKDNIFSIETLKDFQFIDKDGKDNGNLVREKAKTLVELLKDDQKLTEERARATLSRERNTATTGFGSDSVSSSVAGTRSRTPKTSSTTTSTASSSQRSNHPHSVSDSASGGVFKPHIDQSKPSAKDEEELQLQLALRMSKEQADEEEKLRKQEEESLKIALEMSKRETEGQGEEENDDDTENNEPDLLGGLSDPWATGGGGELPPSYDLVTKTSPNKQPASSDPFASTNDPFAPPTLPPDPWTSSSNTTSGLSVSVAPPPSTSTWTSFSPTNTTMSDPFAPLPLAGEIGSTGFDDPPTLPVIPSTSGTSSFDLSAFNPPLDSITTSTSNTDKKPQKVEESFLGTNATLVNLDALTAPLPPPTSSVNPFGIAPLPPAVTPPTARSGNPFESVKAPAPTLAQLQQGPTFDPLPPPLLPGSGTTESFNPFS